ncbi:capsid protein [Weissella muntiaci]|uniref:Capsid protein n=1 Tax=Weissella muntiaci TaxID=2508881 RepID=A0A6C2C4N3_9LACO|nr:minor capsid protein [Weissella muntiaci]TYC48814.1 capsid protein [Weissella muntiaci]
MANAKIDVHVDLSKIYKKLSPAQLAKAQYITANQMLLDMNRLVPMKSKRLRASGSVTRQGDIQYTQVYARAQFYGTNGKQIFHNYTTSGTGKRWDLKAKVLYAPKWGRTFAKAVMKG